jgi:hypothetical protein
MAASAPRAAVELLRLLRLTLERAFERGVERGFCFVIFRLRDPTLFVLEFELKKLFFQSGQYH